MENKMKLLYYNWNSNSNEDICQGFSNLNIVYDVWQHKLNNYEHDDDFSESLSEQLKAYNYDAVFSFDYIPLLSYEAQKRGILYYAWIYDCPQFTLFSDFIYNSCNRIFFFDRVQCQYFKARGVRHAYHMPLAVNIYRINQLHEAGEDCTNGDVVLSTDIKHEGISYMHDISFIGSLYNANMYNQLNYLPSYLRGYLDGIINSQLNIYGYNMLQELLTDNIISELDKYISLDDSVDIKLPHEIVYENMLYDKLAEIERRDVLQRCAKYAEVALYTGSDTNGINDVYKHQIKIMPPVDYNVQLPQIYKQSKINFNITCRSITSGMPLRVLDIMASGGFLISNYQPELAEYFVPGEEMVLYESMSDLEDKVRYYLEHDEERIAIARRGCEKTRAEFSYEKILAEIFK